MENLKFLYFIGERIHLVHTLWIVIFLVMLKIPILLYLFTGTFYRNYHHVCIEIGKSSLPNLHYNIEKEEIS